MTGAVSHLSFHSSYWTVLGGPLRPLLLASLLACLQIPAQPVALDLAWSHARPHWLAVVGEGQSQKEMNEEEQQKGMISEMMHFWRATAIPFAAACLPSLEGVRPDLFAASGENSQASGLRSFL